MVPTEVDRHFRQGFNQRICVAFDVLAWRRIIKQTIQANIDSDELKVAMKSVSVPQI